MTERRCPRCGGLVGADVEWCGQCFTRLDTGRAAPPPARTGLSVASDPETPPAVPQAVVPPPAPETAPPATPGTGPGAPAAGSAGEPATGSAAASPARGSGSGAFLASDDGLRWICPSCELENPLEEGTCSRCGTTFRSLFEEEQEIPAAARAAAPGRSLLYPGLGYGALGRRTEGIARGITFTWMAGMALAVVFVRGGAGLGPFLPLVLVLGAAAALVYVLSYLDARRIAERRAPALSARILLYLSAGTMLLTVVTVVVVALRARG